MECTFFFKLCLFYFIVPCGKFGSPYLGKGQQPQEQRYPFLSVCAVFSCVQTTVWLPVSGIFSVRPDIDACHCTGGCTDTVRKSALEVGYGRKIPCHTGDSNPRQCCAWLFSWTLYPPSCPAAECHCEGALCCQ